MTVQRLREQAARIAWQEGRTDSAFAGLRFYRFSAPRAYRKRQVLVPGIVVVLQGSKEVILSQGTLRYDPMHCLVLGGETYCRGTVVSASAAEPYLAIHLDLPLALLAKALAALADGPHAAEHKPPHKTFVASVDAQILLCLERLLAATETELDRCTIAPLVVEEIVLRLLRLEAAAAIRQVSVVSRAAGRIYASMQYINATLAGALSVESLAEQAAMSPSHYAHLFREVTGVSPMRFVRDARLEAGRALMLGGARVADAAADVGFESSAHFSREFKRRFEAPPAEYVRRMQVSSHGQEDRSPRHVVE